MPTIKNSIQIDAPVEKVFAYVSDPTTTLEWMVSLTNDSGDYTMAKQVARDMRGFFISEDEVENLDPENSEKVLEAIKKMIGTVKSKKG